MMATAGYDPDAASRPGAVAPIEHVAADMRAIFGAVPLRLSGDAGPRMARVRPVAFGRRRWSWALTATVSLAVVLGGGALLGRWAASPPQDMARVAGAAPVVARAAPAARSPDAPTVDPQPVLGPAARSLPTRSDVSTAPLEAPAFPAEAPVAPPTDVPVERIAAPPPIVAPAPAATMVERTDDGDCARFAAACTAADAREAEMQFRAAYAAAAEAGADPRDLVAVRRRLARLRTLDGGQPDRLVTDYARLSGRLGWLADTAATGRFRGEGE